MLFIINFPFADSRNFIDIPTGSLNYPVWPSPIPDYDFVRSMGIIKKRLRGGLTGWVGENLICDARKAIRFPELKPYLVPGVETKIILKVIHRRLYFDGLAVGKFEIAIDASIPPNLSLDNTQIRDLFYHILRLRVNIHNPFGKGITCELCRAGKYLANLYKLSSTNISIVDPNQMEDWWVKPSTPLLLVITYSESIQDEKPFGGDYVPINIDCGFRLLNYSIPVDGLNIVTWDMSDDRGFDARKFRIYLSRFYAERECLKQILANIAKNRIEVIPRSSKSDLLQNYLNASISRINRLQDRSVKMTKTDIEELVLDAEDFIEPGDRDSLLKALENINIRFNIFRKVEKYVNQQVYIQELIMRDKYDVGQAGSVGPNSQANDVNFINIGHNLQEIIDLQELEKELSKLRTVLKKNQMIPFTTLRLAKSHWLRVQLAKRMDQKFWSTLLK